MTGAEPMGIAWRRDGEHVVGRIVKPFPGGGLETVGQVTYTLEQAAQVAGRLLEAIRGKR